MLVNHMWIITFISLRASDRKLPASLARDIWFSNMELPKVPASEAKVFWLMISVCTWVPSWGFGTWSIFTSTNYIFSLLKYLKNNKFAGLYNQKQIKSRNYDGYLFGARLESGKSNNYKSIPPPTSGLTDLNQMPDWCCQRIARDWVPYFKETVVILMPLRTLLAGLKFVKQNIVFWSLSPAAEKDPSCLPNLLHWQRHLFHYCIFDSLAIFLRLVLGAHTLLYDLFLYFFLP